jgi:hypothetical protein
MLDEVLDQISVHVIRRAARAAIGGAALSETTTGPFMPLGA